MTTHRFLTITIALFAGPACGALQGNQAVEVSTRDATLNSRWHANLASPASLAGVVQMNGSASMAPGQNGTGTSVTLRLANASPGGLHPWGVHQGQCGVAMDYGVFGPSEAYRPLKVDSDGHANGTATVPLETPKTGNYFVVVRASDANSETIVACGNLAPPTQ